MGAIIVYNNLYLIFEIGDNIKQKIIINIMGIILMIKCFNDIMGIVLLKHLGVHGKKDRRIWQDINEEGSIKTWGVIIMCFGMRGIAPRAIEVFL